MKKETSIKKYIIIPMVLVSFFVLGSTAHADSDKNQSSDKSQVVKENKNNTDSNDQADNNKPESDLETRRTVLLSIVTSSIEESDSLKEKLNKLDLDDNWSKVRDYFIGKIDQNDTYYQQTMDKIKDPNTTVDDLKQIAKSIKDFRESTYTPELQKISNMVLIFEGDSLLQTAQSRLDKVSSDIKKLDKQKLIKTDPLKDYLTKANKRLSNGVSLTNRSKDTFYKDITNEMDADASKKDAQESEMKALSAESSIASDKKQTTKDPQDKIRDMEKSAYLELKATYEIFFKMNDQIKKSL